MTIIENLTGLFDNTRQKELRRKLVDAWTLDNLPLIRRELINSTGGIMWPDKSLSERASCMSWDHITPPTGFRRTINGSVIIMHEGKAYDEPFPHTFAINRWGEVICFTVGQFYDYMPGFDKTNLESGDRMKRLYVMAPDLITYYYNGEIARLYGTVKQVEEKLGLRYMK